MNFACVGIVALPLIDTSRAIARFLNGKSDVFGGLVVQWIERFLAARGRGPGAGPGAGPGSGGEGA